jgi:hypothetical protein
MTSNGPVAGSYEHGNGPSGSIKGRQFLDQLSDFQYFKNDPAQWNKLAT